MKDEEERAKNGTKYEEEEEANNEIDYQAGNVCAMDLGLIAEIE